MRRKTKRRKERKREEQREGGEGRRQAPAKVIVSQLDWLSSL